MLKVTENHVALNKWNAPSYDPKKRDLNAQCSIKDMAMALLMLCLENGRRNLPNMWKDWISACSSGVDRGC